MESHSQKPGIHSRHCRIQIYLQAVLLKEFKLYFTAICLVCPVSSVGEREREREREGGPDTYLPARVHSWRAGESGRMREGGGGYSLTAKQEVAQHLFLGIQRGSEWPAVCFTVCPHVLHPSRQTMWHSSLFPNSLKSESNCLALLKLSISLK